MTKKKKKTASLLRDNLKSFTGHAALYSFDPPLEDYDWSDEPAKKHKYVILSAVTVMFTGSETYIFPSNGKGEIVSWGELPGSQRGTLSHEKVISDLGYTLMKGK